MGKWQCRACGSGRWAGSPFLALSAPGVAGDEWPAGAICTPRDDSSAAAIPARLQSPPARLRCAPWPKDYHQIQQAGGGTGDVSLGLAVGAAPDGRQLCYVYNAVPEAPVIRVRAGHRLTVRLEDTLNDDGAAHDRNCPVQTYVDGGACAQPEQGFRAEPGADGPFYPIETNVPHMADGTTNLHVHGFSVSALPCHDEVLKSAVYPANWTGPTATLAGCQSGPNALTYRYDIPADHPTGLYWYHSHRHGQAEAATMLGLSGAIVIEGAADDLRRRQGVTDDVLIVRDFPADDGSRGAPEAQRHRLNRARRLNGAQGVEPAASGPADPRIDRANEVACGPDDPDDGGPQKTRLTLNGAVVPEAPNGAPPPDAVLLTKSIEVGERQLWRLLNASADTYISPRLVQATRLGSTVLPLVVVARDGVPVADDGGRQKVETVDTTRHPILLAPGNRLEFLVTAPPPGGELYLESAGVKPGCAGDGDPPRRLLRAVATGEVTGPSRTGDADLRPEGRNAYYTHLLDTAPAVTRRFAFSEYPRGFAVEHSIWQNGAPKPGQYDPDGTDFLLTETASSAGDLGTVALKPFDMHSLGQRRGPSGPWPAPGRGMDDPELYAGDPRLPPAPGAFPPGAAERPGSAARRDQRAPGRPYQIRRAGCARPGDHPHRLRHIEHRRVRLSLPCAGARG